MSRTGPVGRLPRTLERLHEMSDDLVIGIALTALAYGGLIATVVHARAVIRRLSDEEFEGGLPGYDERPGEEADADE